MTKSILIVLLVFVLGALGGMWSQAFLLPSMAANPAFQDWQFIKDWNARTQVIAPVQQVTIQENVAVERLIQRAQQRVVVVESTSGRTGPGLVFTSDGLIVAAASLVPQGVGVIVHLSNEETVPAQVQKRDAANNLALIKIEKQGLQTTGFLAQEGVALGQSLVMLSKDISGGEISTTANQGMVTRKDELTFATSMSGSSAAAGAPLFALDGNVAGMAFIGRQGTVQGISSSVLRTFLGL